MGIEAGKGSCRQREQNEQSPRGVKAKGGFRGQQSVQVSGARVHGWLGWAARSAPLESPSILCTLLSVPAGWPGSLALAGLANGRYQGEISGEGRLSSAEGSS